MTEINWQLVQAMQMLKKETKLQISNSKSAELRNKYQHLVSNDAFWAQFPFYTNASALSPVIILGNTWNKTTTSSCIFQSN